MTDNKYNYGREVIFELRACHAISAEVYMHWLEKIDKEEQLTIPAIVEPPKINSKDFKDWLKSEGYKNKGFGIYQKENKDCCYKLLYKHYYNIQELGKRPNTSSTLECFTKSEKQQKGNV